MPDWASVPELGLIDLGDSRIFGGRLRDSLRRYGMDGRLIEPAGRIRWFPALHRPDAKLEGVDALRACDEILKLHPRNRGGLSKRLPNSKA